MAFKKIIKSTFFLVAAFFVAFSFNQAHAQTTNEISFNVDKNFDLSQRTQVQAVLVKTEPNLYFYVEKSWWDGQTFQQQEADLADLDKLSSEFDLKIYPNLTSIFGSEWRPGVDGDTKMTVLFQSMNQGMGGYFRQNDEYVKLQVPDSNEREMMYISLSYINNPSELKEVLAHEFMHMIIFNQKNRLQDVQEDQWLDEAISDYTSTVLGYDNNYAGSNLQSRVYDFVQSPSNSLVEFLNSKYDFASVHMFISYLVDHYGIGVLSDIVKSKDTGITAINDALVKNGFTDDFSQVFTNWTIAVALNDCTQDTKYCYLNKNLSSIKISPTLNFLPTSGDSSLSVTNATKNWAGNWQKIIGGNGELKLSFESLSGLDFKVPYIIFASDGTYSINYIKLDSSQKGAIDIKNFGTNYISLILIPSLQSKTSDFDGFEFTYPYSFKATITGNTLTGGDTALIQQLLNQIASLTKQLADLQTLADQKGTSARSCVLTENMTVGMRDGQIACLQQFLKSQGVDVYPEGLVTGYFGSLTTQAVVRFQEKYKSEILTPLGLSYGTGYVGSATRVKINQLMGSQ